MLVWRISAFLSSELQNFVLYNVTFQKHKSLLFIHFQTFSVFLSSFSNWFHLFQALAWFWWYIIDIDYNRSGPGDTCIFISQISEIYSDDHEWIMSKAGTVQGKWGTLCLWASVAGTSLISDRFGVLDACARFQGVPGLCQTIKKKKTVFWQICMMITTDTWWPSSWISSPSITVVCCLEVCSGVQLQMGATDALIALRSQVEPPLIGRPADAPPD